jgi:hypothetical protein
MLIFTCTFGFSVDVHSVAKWGLLGSSFQFEGGLSNGVTFKRNE